MDTNAPSHPAAANVAARDPLPLWPVAIPVCRRDGGHAVPAVRGTRVDSMKTLRKEQLNA